MDENKTHEELIKKLKTMSLQDLEIYEDYAVTMSKGLNIFGVSAILAALMYTQALVVIASGILVILFATLSVTTDMSLKLIREQKRKILEKGNT